MISITPKQALEEYLKWDNTIDRHTVQFYDDDYCDIGFNRESVKTYPVQLMIKYRFLGDDLEHKWDKEFKPDKNNAQALRDNSKIIDSMIITMARQNGGYPIVKDMFFGWKWVYLIKPEEGKS